ncbi:MAG: hypothetical protein QXZ44_07080 [Ferroplasma sp.]
MRRKIIIILFLIFILAFTFSELNQNGNYNSKMINNSESINITNSTSNTNICTFSKLPEYYNETFSTYNNTEFAFNLSWNHNGRTSSETENNIILWQNGQKLISIVYGIENNGITTVEGLKKYNNTLNLSEPFHIYTVHIILSKYSNRTAFIYQGSNNFTIPQMVILKHPFTQNKLTFSFGGNYSNQTIGPIKPINFKNFIVPSNYVKGNYTLKYQGNFNYSYDNMDNAYVDTYLNSIIYINKTYGLIAYNYIDNKSTVIGHFANQSYGNISLINYGSYIVYYANSGNTMHILEINKTNLKSREAQFTSHLNHLLIFHDNYVLFNTNGTFYFPKSNEAVRIPAQQLLSVHSGNDITISALNNSRIINYTINSNIILSSHKYLNISENYSIIYIPLNNGLLSMMENNSIIENYNNEIFYNLKFVGSRILVNNNTIYAYNSHKLANTEIAYYEGTISYSNNSLLIAKNKNFKLYSDVNISSPYIITINQIHEIVKYENTTITFNISSRLNYSISANFSNKNYTVDNNVLIFNFTGLPTGRYLINVTAQNEAGYTVKEKYLFDFNNTVIREPVVVVKTVMIKEINGKFTVFISGNNTKNLTVAWYINGKLSNYGMSLDSALPMGYDHISVKIVNNGRKYTATKDILVLGLIPYYASAAVIAGATGLFLINLLYYKNTGMDELILKYDGKPLKEVFKICRKNRIRKSRMKARIHALQREGKLSIDSDMNNQKYIIRRDKN